MILHVIRGNQCILRICILHDTIFRIIMKSKEIWISFMIVNDIIWSIWFSFWSLSIIWYIDMEGTRIIYWKVNKQMHMLHFFFTKTKVTFSPHISSVFQCSSQLRLMNGIIQKLLLFKRQHKDNIFNTILSQKYRKAISC